MKALKPSHREHKRYLLIRGKATREDIEEAILKFVGILGYSKASPMFVKMERKVDGFVLSINRQELDKVRASFLLSGKDIRIVSVSGALGKL